MNHYQFFCSHLPSIVITAKTYARAETIATIIYFDTIEHFNLGLWSKPIEGYYVGYSPLQTVESGRLSQFQPTNTIKAA